VKTLRTGVKAANLGIVRLPPKEADPFYASPDWKALRHACLERDGWRCVMCGQPAIVADHILSRRSGGADTLANLRSLCRLHDNGFKEDVTGARRTPRG
jgi:5-methylcytosine-specific restriction endonuclease McrA